MPTPESRIKTKVKRALVERGIYYITPATGGYGRSGVPDFIVCIRGRFLALECKANGNIPTPLQEREMENICRSGGCAHVINESNVDSLPATLDIMLDDRSEKEAR